MKKRILLVEDEPTIHRLLHFILAKEFDVRSAANGYEAFLWLERQEIPDLIIMDWMMPQMDGKSFLKCLKVSGLYCDIPVIVLSASERIREELDSLPYPIRHCLKKPFDPRTLKATIGNIFNVSTYGFVN
ncbi:response regulator [Parapedobacter soli]|uniref:response regulator n=1 Tax=Parapedobacter soli TaxID=416955 RepID=UPI0021CA1FDE|nr:response regulator [Parapedobacter soli]